VSKPIFIRPQASQDIDDAFLFITQDDQAAALRFFDAVRLTLAQLGRMPGIGAIFLTTNPRLASLRKWPVKGFKRYLIFYFEHDDQVEVVRILQASRDLSSILDTLDEEP